jgi:glycerol-3-phosphate acyltransferase PlsY
MNSRNTSTGRLTKVALAAGVGYLVGSFSWADLAARRATAGQVDLRVAGSGNPGALNAIETLGKRWGVAVGVGDVVKGATASVVGRAIAGDIGAHVGGTAAVVGHCYPIWTGFRGGKGVASACGQCIATFPAAVPIEIVAGAVGILGPFERRSHTTTVLLTTTWVVTGLLWWLRRWPNRWGPAPTIALPLTAAVSSAVVLRRFADEQRRSLR